MFKKVVAAALSQLNYSIWVTRNEAWQQLTLARPEILTKNVINTMRCIVLNHPRIVNSDDWVKKLM